MFLEPHRGLDDRLGYEVQGFLALHFGRKFSAVQVAGGGLDVGEVQPLDDDGPRLDRDQPAVGNGVGDFVLQRAFRFRRMRLVDSSERRLVRAAGVAVIPRCLSDAFCLK